MLPLTQTISGRPEMKESARPQPRLDTSNRSVIECGV